MGVHNHSYFPLTCPFLEYIFSAPWGLKCHVLWNVSYEICPMKYVLWNVSYKMCSMKYILSCYNFPSSGTFGQILSHRCRCIRHASLVVMRNTTRDWGINPKPPSIQKKMYFCWVFKQSYIIKRKMGENRWKVIPWPPSKIKNFFLSF